MITKTTFWNLITNYKISIPLVQRDYAFGRVHEAGKRDKLLNSIHKHLGSNKSLHLDFVYGRIEGDTFFPIDGQQKLTTLFLLHWYSSLKEDIHIDDRMILDRFVYDLRISSRDFCHALVHEGLEIPTGTHSDGLAHAIRNKYWYRNFWDNDSTIQAMLVMIDAIHQKFNNIKSRSLWDYLTQDDLISFDLLDLGEKGYVLTDHLYIKMNSRGKQLTPFEIFKANFILLLERQYKGKRELSSFKGEVSYSDYFSYKIEKEWTDLFWAFQDDNKNIDDHFSNYFKFITQLLYSKKNKDANANDFTNSFAQYIQVYSYEENLLFLFDSLNELHKLVIQQGLVDKDSIDNFINSIKNKASAMGMAQENAH